MCEKKTNQSEQKELQLPAVIPERKAKRWRRFGIGVHEFRKFRKMNCYYVDKTGFIEEFLESAEAITMITRPSRFGKTLQLSMLSEFLDCTKESMELFKGTGIYSSEYMEKCNQYPVIRVSFAQARGQQESWLLHQICKEIAREYQRHSYLIKSEKLSNEKRCSLRQIWKGLTGSGQSFFGQLPMLAESLRELSIALETHWEKHVILLVDEYDTPFIAAYGITCREETTAFLHHLFCLTLKDNPALYKALLMGTYLTGKEVFFEEIKDVAICTVRDHPYRYCFGFTDAQAEHVLGYRHIPVTEQTYEMYGGYQIAKRTLYNPWSVLCLAVRKKQNYYWINTMPYSFFVQVMYWGGEGFKRELWELMEKGELRLGLCLDSSYYEQKTRVSAWNVYLQAGLITVKIRMAKDDYVVRITGKEAVLGMRRITAASLYVNSEHVDGAMFALRMGNMDDFAFYYKRMAKGLPMYEGVTCESSFHVLKVAIFSYLKDYYNVEAKWCAGNEKEVEAGSAEVVIEDKRKCEKADRYGELWLIPKVTNRITIWIHSYYAETEEDFENYTNTSVEKLVPESARMLQQEELWGKGINYVRIDHWQGKIEVRFL